MSQAMPQVQKRSGARYHDPTCIDAAHPPMHMYSSFQTNLVARAVPDHAHEASASSNDPCPRVWVAAQVWDNSPDGTTVTPVTGTGAPLIKAGQLQRSHVSGSKHRLHLLLAC
jgi:hypothetical protein